MKNAGAWRDLGCRLALAAITIALWFSRLEGPLDLRWDAAVYYQTGVALAEGRGYSLLNEPGQVAAVQYPPGLPGIVAACALVSDSSDPLVVATRLRIVWFALAVVLAQLTYSFARRFFEPAGALLAAALGTLAFPTWYFAELLFAELPLAVLVLLFLLAARRRESASRSVALAALGIGAFLLRTIGVVLLAAWVGESLLARRFRSAALRAAVAALPIVAWGTYVRSVTQGDEWSRPAYEYQRAPYQFHNVPYGENLDLVDPFVPELGTMTAGDWLRRVGTNVAGLPLRVGEALTASQAMASMLIRETIGPTIPLARRHRLAGAWLVVVSAIVVIGAASLARGGERVVVITLAGAVALLCSTPWPVQFGRYLMPFAAVLAVALVRGAVVVAGQRGPTFLARARWAVAGSLVASVLAVQVGAMRSAFGTRNETPLRFAPDSSSRVSARPFYYDRAWVDFEHALEWIRDDGRPADVTASSEASYVSIRTGRPSVLPPFEVDPSEVLRLLDGVPVRYVVVDRFEHVDCAGRYALPAMLAAPDRWELVLSTPRVGVKVFRRRD